MCTVSVSQYKYIPAKCSSPIHLSISQIFDVLTRPGPNFTTYDACEYVLQKYRQKFKINDKSWKRMMVAHHMGIELKSQSPHPVRRSTNVLDCHLQSNTFFL